MARGRIFRPEMVLRLTVPLPARDGARFFTLEPRIIRARHVRNDHNHADELEVTASWVDTGVDPRWIAGAICEFYLWDAHNPPDEDDGLGGSFGLGPVDGPPRGALRFIGRLVKPARAAKAENLSVDLLFHDYTSYYLLAKRYASEGVPYYDETLGEAWIRICDNVPGVQALGDNIELRGLQEFPVIGSAVAPRFRSKGQVPVKPNTDAWAVWQKCVGMMGLISFFELDTCVVTTADAYYTAREPPRLIWGENILEISEERNNERALKGVGLTSFNAITGETIESLYNPLLNNRHKVKAAAKTRRKAATVSDDKEFDIFAIQGITDQEALDRLARRVYEERSRQELEGKLVTAEMTVGTTGDRLFDLLALGSGDTIQVQLLGDEDARFVKQFLTQDARRRYLVDKGYSEQVAEIIAANVDEITNKSNLYHVKTVTTELESTPDGGQFRVNIDYCNKIDPSVGAGEAES